MDKRQIRNLAKNSFVGNYLDQKKVYRVFKILKRKNLKLYLKELKNIDKQKTVIVNYPSFKLAWEIRRKIENFFPDKKIKYIHDPSLLTGIKIINNDLVCDITLRKSLDNLISYIYNSYD